ncbi:MAG: serine/threonine-protein kinase [Gemmataceae bacterium]
MSFSGSIDRQTFLTYLRMSGLVGDDQLAAIQETYPDIQRGRSLARALVRAGYITRFQAERVLVGQTSGFLLGQYRILEQIGKGGMGRIYKAEHRTMRRTVALKVLSNRLLSTERAVQLFLHEVRAAAALQHPNIVIAYDASVHQDRHFLVLEYVDGPNLDQLVRQQGRLSVGLACDYIRQVANGLQCAHLLGMVHRDLKPANILVQWHGLLGESSPGLVKISDFGLARLATPAEPLPGHTRATLLTHDNTVMGTPDYLSPEQARSLHKTDIRSDLYGLGCTFYFLLTGQVPFPGGTALDKIIRHATEKPHPLAELRPEVPAEVVSVVERLMAKVPDDRFSTPAELADALQPYAVSGPTPWARPRTPAEMDLADLDGPSEEAYADRDSLPVDGSDPDLAALGRTLDSSMLDTPMAASPSQIILRHLPREQRPFGLALAAGITIAIGILALLMAIALVASR